MICKFLSFITFIVFIMSLHAQEKTVIRVGHFPNITHAQAVIAHGLTRKGKGWFEERLGPNVEIQWFIYLDGPSAMEAIFAHAIDMTYVGPSPTINAFLKTDGKEIRIICGACSGGSSLVVQPEIKKLDDFLNKKIATPQFGNTQDIAARMWFKSLGFDVRLTGGDVMVIPMSGSTQFILFKQKDLDGAWTVEPWVSRLVLEADGTVFLEEKELWTQTGGCYVTTHLVSSVNFLEQKPDIVRKWIAAHVQLTEWIQKHPDESKELFNDEFNEEVKRKLSNDVLDRAWKKIELTYAPIKKSLFKYAEDAYQIGFIKEKPNLNGIYDLRFLNEIMETKYEQ